MKLDLAFYSDPSHGWLQVPHSLVNQLGIANKISRYSYMDANSAYLEEDCDLSIFMQKAKETGLEIGFIDRYTNYDSPIRRYNRYFTIGE
jgi:hypothetical protein